MTRLHSTLQTLALPWRPAHPLPRMPATSCCWTTTSGGGEGGHVMGQRVSTEAGSTGRAVLADMYINWETGIASTALATWQHTS